MYRHNIMRINYTTYDVRRAQDTINPRTDHRDIILLAPWNETIEGVSTHQYLYARVLGIYHVNVIYGGQPGRPASYRPRRMEFLWVRWFQTSFDIPVQKGWETASLDRLTFLRLDHEDAFGFVSPDQVLRACHVIPRFSSGRVLSEHNIGISGLADDRKDWKEYFVNRQVHFVDDLLMQRLSVD